MLRANWLKKVGELFGRHHSTNTKVSLKRRGQALERQPAEVLEARSLLSVSAVYVASTGELDLELDSSDSVRVGSVNGLVRVDTISPGGVVTPFDSLGTLAAQDVKLLVIVGGDDGNSIDLSAVTAAAFTSLTAIEVDAGNGDDLVTGSSDFAESLVGGHGKDTLLGQGGNDTLVGGNGNDSIVAGTGNDSVRSGDGQDSVTGDAGSDTIDSGDGDDTVSGGDDNDSIFAGNGQDSLNGDAGNDTLNGDGGTDTMSGGDGNDSMLGGEFHDLMLGDAGDDTLLGQGGNDTLIGVTGADRADGGVGHDLIQSALETPDDPVPAAAAPAPANPVSAPLPDAVDSTLGSDVGASSTTIGTGTGDGSLSVQVTATGAFGLGNVPNSTIAGAVFDPLGATGVSSSTFESDLYFRSSTVMGTRTSLETLATNSSTIRATSAEANSTFEVGSLEFALTQLTEPMFDKTTGQQIGSLLTQTYRITNTGGVTSQFELARYFDGDLQFDGSLIDGGGRLVSEAGDEFLFETDGGDASASTTMVGVTAKGGTIPTTNRFAIDQYPNLQNLLEAGGALDGQIRNDTDGDQSIDVNYDVSLGFRNTFSLAADETATYTTHTLFVTGTPDQLDLNQNPVAVDDAGRATAGQGVAIDVVSNDFDLDGSLIYSSLQITQQPAFGTAIPLPEGRIRYTANAGFSGTDTYFYTILDNLGAPSNAASVVMTVTAVDTVGDALNAGNGNDTVIGSDGHDTILGGSGQDSLLGGLGNDRIQGQGGNDTLVGGGGADNVTGGTDTLNGGDGQDVLESLAARPVIDDVTVLEGDFGTSLVTFNITLAETSFASVVLNFRTVDGTAIAGQDYVAASGQLIFAAGETQKTVSVEVNGDVLGEPSEYFTLRLAPVSNTLIEVAEATATIADDDVGVTVSDVVVPEGNSGTATLQFTVNLSVASTAAVFVDFNMTDDDANAIADAVTIVAPPSVFAITQDYVATTGRVVILPGATSVTIDVSLLGDTESEDDERFFVNLSNAMNAAILDSQGNGIIQNDDGGGPFLHPITDENYITLSPRWRTTATDGPGLVQGDATVLTFGIVPDGTLVPDLGGNLAPSDLIARLDFIYNETATGPDVTNRTWFSLVQSVFDVYASFSGTTYVYEPNDDGADVDDYDFTQFGGGGVAPGILGVRPDLRIGGTDLDGDFGVLGFNGFPETGDMVLDTNDDVYLDTSNTSVLLRNVLAHEHGHGLGLRHVLPITQTILMEPFLYTGFDGPQEDDILATNRGYGDRNEKDRGNDVSSIATLLGILTPATGSNTSQLQMNGVSIDDDSDTDFYEFSVTNTADLSITVNPTGSKYLSGVQFPQPPIVSPFNARTQSDLAFDLITADGVTVLSSLNAGGFGFAESMTLTSLAAGKYFIRVTGAQDLAQMYDLSVTADAVTVAATEDTIDAGDTHLGGEGNDTVIGATGNDTMNGQGGNDSLFGNTGDDLVLGGSGMDTLLGGTGSDTLDGQGGADLLDGGLDNDTYLWNGAPDGNDTIVSASGLDTASVIGTGSPDAIALGQSAGSLTATFGGATLTIPQQSVVANLVVNGLGGNDTLSVGTIDQVRPLVLILNGGDGNDLLDATGASIGGVRLALNGDNGNDTIYGSLGNDTINGNDGDDSLCGLAGNDTMIGGLGQDSLGGSLGNDLLNGGEGADVLNGQQGDDSVLGGFGNDTLKGDIGNDTLLGGSGDDDLNGMAGDDSILGGVGKDALLGGVGNDTLDGGRNDDMIGGNAGDDHILGDHGNDVINAGDGNNTISGGDGDDMITAGVGNDLISGGDGNDRINADDGDDMIVGGDGNDSVQAGAGQDIIRGGDGDDSINGQGGTDTIASGQGNDIVVDPVSEIHENFVLSATIQAILDAI